MSFITEITEIFDADASLNETVDVISNVKLPDNWIGGDTESIWMVYESNRASEGDCLSSKNVYMNYALTIVLIERGDNATLDSLSQYLINKLNNHESGGILDIGFTGDGPTFNEQMNTYTNTLTFECVYKEN